MFDRRPNATPSMPSESFKFALYDIRANILRSTFSKGRRGSKPHGRMRILFKDSGQNKCYD